jgi:hypothetical protein
MTTEINEAKFFTAWRMRFGRLNQGQVNALGKLLEYFEQDQNQKLLNQVAYQLATVHWETNRTFEPVREAYWLSEEWRKRNLRYYPFYG